MKLFPQYLNIGSEGPAVLLLQLLLIALKFNHSKIVPDSQYKKETAQGVMEFQAEAQVEQDGNFGPATRAAFLGATGIDINALLAERFEGETIAADSGETPDLTTALFRSKHLQSMNKKTF